MTTGDELDQFVGDMLAAKEFSGVTDDVRKQLISDLKKELVNMINRALINALPDEKVDELNTLLDDTSVDDAQIERFITESGVDAQDVAARTMLRFRDSYLGVQTQETE